MCCCFNRYLCLCSAYFNMSVLMLIMKTPEEHVTHVLGTVARQQCAATTSADLRNLSCGCRDQHEITPVPDSPRQVLQCSQQSAPTAVAAPPSGGLLAMAAAPPEAGSEGEEGQEKEADDDGSIAPDATEIS
jgi:hypothetical protein